MAFLLAPTEESTAVIQVPMFCPMTMGMAAAKLDLAGHGKRLRNSFDAEEDLDNGGPASPRQAHTEHGVWKR